MKKSLRTRNLDILIIYMLGLGFSVQCYRTYLLIAITILIFRIGNLVALRFFGSEEGISTPLHI